MSRRRALVTGHLEDVSWKVLADYREAVRSLIRGKSGVYALYRKDRLYYVGLASNLMGRLDGHLRDRHHNKWDRFSVYATVQEDHMKELESLILRVAAPPGNRTGGRFSHSQNLRAGLHRHMKDHDSARQAALLGGQVALRRSRSQARRARGSAALAGFVQRVTTLRAWRAGWVYRATLRRDGVIKYDGRAFDSPRAAARAAGCPGSGWTFWRYRNKRGQWVPLKTLK